MRDLLRKVNILSTVISAAIAAVVFVIPVYMFVRDGNYTETWLLYMGSFLFGLVVGIHTYLDSKKRKHQESTVALIFASHAVTILGIAIACALSFIILAVGVPGYLGGGESATVLENEPANTINDSTDGLQFQVFLVATIVNFSVGSFIGIILPFSAKRNQKKDAPDPAPLHQRGSH